MSNDQLRVRIKHKKNRGEFFKKRLLRYQFTEYLLFEPKSILKVFDNSLSILGLICWKYLIIPCWYYLNYLKKIAFSDAISVAIKSCAINYQLIFKYFQNYFHHTKKNHKIIFIKSTKFPKNKLKSNYFNNFIPELPLNLSRFNSTQLFTYANYLITQTHDA